VTACGLLQQSRTVASLQLMRGATPGVTLSKGFDRRRRLQAERRAGFTCSISGLIDQGSLGN
jgi:hypothetical protein